MARFIGDDKGNIRDTQAEQKAERAPLPQFETQWLINGIPLEIVLVSLPLLLLGGWAGSALLLPLLPSSGLLAGFLLLALFVAWWFGCLFVGAALLDGWRARKQKRAGRPS